MDAFVCVLLLACSWSWSQMSHTGVHCASYHHSISTRHPQQHLSSPAHPPTFTPEGGSVCDSVCDCVFYLQDCTLKTDGGFGRVKVSGTLRPLSDELIVKTVCACVCVCHSSTTWEDQEVQRGLCVFLSKCRFHSTLVCGCFSWRPVISCVSCAVKFSRNKGCFFVIFPTDQTLLALQ